VTAQSRLTSRARQRRIAVSFRGGILGPACLRSGVRRHSRMLKMSSLLLLGGVCVLSGCAAVGSRIVGEGYFQGVRCDYAEMFRRDTIDPQCRIHPALAAIDMPFSFIGDILFLPIDFYDSCERASNTNAVHLQE
jgi:uncharacterized protein YceK